MTAHHHPSEELLTAFATGLLDHGEHIVVAAHVAQCSECQAFVHAIEELAGETLEEIVPAAMRSKALSDRALSNVDIKDIETVPSVKSARSPASLNDLPAVLSNYELGPWKWLAPGVSLRPIILSGPSRSRAFILRSKPGTRMLEHTHSGVELTHVISGEFAHEGGRFAAGDFDYGDETLHHQPVVGGGQPCVCLVAMTGELEPNGLIGRLMKPFIRL